MGGKKHLLLGAQECSEAKKQGVALMRPQLSSVWLGVLKFPAPTVTAYPVRSSLSLGKNFIFFFLGSDDLLVARKVEKKDISDRQWSWANLCS